MYKANGFTKSFPLPASAGGYVSAVYWVDASGSLVELHEGASFVISDGNVVFGEAPPAGVTVVFEPPAGTAVSGKTPVCTLVYPDGRVEAVHEDPAVLLTLARKELEEARQMVSAAQIESGRILNLALGYEATARETLSSKLDKYRELVEDAVTQAAAGARDEINDNAGRKLLEIREKHREVTAAHEDIARLAEEARGAAGHAGEELREKLRAEGRELIEGIERAAREREEFERTIADARHNMDVFRTETLREFSSRSEAILEEVRSLKRVLEGEIKSVVEGAKRAMDSSLAEVRAHRGEMRNSVKHMNRIERFVMERKGEA
jgi:hypothetical protein